MNDDLPKVDTVDNVGRVNCVEIRIVGYSRHKVNILDTK